MRQRTIRHPILIELRIRATYCDHVGTILDSVPNG